MRLLSSHDVVVRTTHAFVQCFDRRRGVARRRRTSSTWTDSGSPRRRCLIRRFSRHLERSRRRTSTPSDKGPRVARCRENRRSRAASHDCPTSVPRCRTASKGFEQKYDPRHDARSRASRWIVARLSLTKKFHALDGRGHVLLPRGEPPRDDRRGVFGVLLRRGSRRTLAGAHRGFH